MKTEDHPRAGRSGPRTSHLLAALGMAVVLVASACSTGTTGTTSDGASTPEELTPVQLQMHFLPEVSWAAHLYGIEHGIFERHGIELELIPGQGSNFTMQQLNEDQVQFGQATLITYLVHRAEADSATTAVFPLIDHPQAGILTTVEAASLDDMVGKTMAVIPFGTIKNILPIVLQENGLEPDAIKLEDAQPSLALLLEGTVDAMEGFLGSNVATGIKLGQEAGIDVYHLDLHDFGLDGYGQTLIVRNEMVENDPELVQSMVTALRESLLAALDTDPEELGELVSGYAPEIAAEDMILEWDDYREIINDTGGLDEAVVQANLDYVTDGLGISHDLQPEDVFTNEFVPSD